MTENTENLWKEVRKTAGKVTELETTMNIEIPALKTGISDLKDDMKDGFKGIGDKLDKSRTKDEETKTGRHKVAYSTMFTLIIFLAGWLIKLAMAGG